MISAQNRGMNDHGVTKTLLRVRVNRIERCKKGERGSTNAGKTQLRVTGSVGPGGEWRYFTGGRPQVIVPYSTRDAYPRMGIDGFSP